MSNLREAKKAKQIRKTSCKLSQVANWKRKAAKPFFGHRFSELSIDNANRVIRSGLILAVNILAGIGSAHQESRADERKLLTSREIA